ncbi:uncharacterized protein LOC122085949 [Macadamia integrifolia]|uniref:uncharacterized protein LOC122085949 n=1 Tax=Macadamia integrifolia TaxID=60698 RepID=UPI001C4F8067|nr:uncharacterized protein LOC122085949 [Macadamia integrifolia]
MILKSVTPPSALLSVKPHLLRTPCLLPLFNVRALHLKKKANLRRIRDFKCRAEFSEDAPFAVAIGACVLNSLIFPVSGVPQDDENSAIDATDARFAVMGIISFIPYFNWLSWVFAWLDTGRRRYVIYSIVYLAPYLRTNLSLSPEESWLPIASIVFCIIHIQLEASISNGDLQGFQQFGAALKSLSSMTRQKDVSFEDHQGSPEKGREKEKMNPPSAGEKSSNEIQGQRRVDRKPLDEHRHPEENGDSNDTSID